MNNWHTLNNGELEVLFDTNIQKGLTRQVAHQRHLKQGPNVVPAVLRRSALKRFLDELRNPLIYVLALAGLLTLYLENYLDASVIGSVILINALIGFSQSSRAEKAISEVGKLLPQTARVLRDGTTTELPVEELVTGDVFLLFPGDRVPADARAVEEANLFLDESSLTGESMPVEKRNTVIPHFTVISEQSNMIFAGTTVSSGTAKAVVVATGLDTELGKIGKLLGGIGTLKTPLTRRLDKLARQIAIGVLAISALTLLYGFYVNKAGFEFIFAATVGLAVSAIPEGLPAVVSITLAAGTRWMARSRVIVRRLPAVEALGSVSVILTDKTGTLTKNEMTVVAITARSRELQVSGSGYEPVGQISGLSKNLDELWFQDLLKCAVLCNDAELRKIHTGEWSIVGDPTEASLLTLAAKAGLEKKKLDAIHPRIKGIPFDSQRRFMATVNATDNANNNLYLKGAPEEVLDLCSLEFDGKPIDKKWWLQKVEVSAKKGYRLLALAKADDIDPELLSSDNTAPETKKAVSRKLVLLGLVSIIDPPRPEAIQAVQECKNAGIRVIMITGDHVSTAQAVAEKLGLQHHKALSGLEIAELDSKTLAKRLESTNVIARATPEHKLKLLKAIQAKGLLVAMTGDGVNDAPALRAADIGVAMGKKGTESARAASDIVLLDDNFESIVAAIRRGRIVYDNIKKAMLFLLSTDIDEATVIILAVLFGFSLPVTPTQILWINLVTSVTLSFALVFEKAEGNIMRRGPSENTKTIVNLRMLSRMLLVSTLSVLATFGVFFSEISRGNNLAVAQTAAVLMLVLAEIAHLFNVRRFTDNAITREGFFGNKILLLVVGILLLLQLAFSYLPFMNIIFGSQPLDAFTWMLAGSFAVAIFLAVELEKWVRRRLGLTNF